MYSVTRKPLSTPIPSWPGQSGPLRVLHMPGQNGQGFLELQAVAVA